MCGELKRNRSELIRQIRRTMQEIRIRREHLRTHPGNGADAGPDPGTRLADKYALTPREIEVALLLATGAANVEIASVLRISEHTARHHTRHVLAKLDVHTRARAAAVIAREFQGGVTIR
jgi:DNA-binding CsgD family transcriptional regulator